MKYAAVAPWCSPVRLPDEHVVHRMDVLRAAARQFPQGKRMLMSTLPSVGHRGLKLGLGGAWGVRMALLHGLDSGTRATTTQARTDASALGCILCNEVGSCFLLLIRFEWKHGPRVASNLCSRPMCLVAPEPDAFAENCRRDVPSSVNCAERPSGSSVVCRLCFAV